MYGSKIIIIMCHLQVRALGVKLPDEMHIPFFREGVGSIIYIYIHIYIHPPVN